MSQTSFLSEAEIKELGLKAWGRDVMISRFCRLYNPQRISLGNHVRVDDFCILSGNITIHDYVHISAYVGMFSGDCRIEIGENSAISSRIAIYAESDDYSGNSLVNPLIPDTYKTLQKGDVIINKNVIIGSGSTILPGVTVGEGVAVGAMSLINRPLAPWRIYAGIPAREIKDRSKRLLELEREWKKERDADRL